MAKNKERLLFLLKSLMNTSDGASDYTLKELEELYENNGLSATQKTIRNDISKLIEAGMVAWLCNKERTRRKFTPKKYRQEAALCARDITWNSRRS